MAGIIFDTVAITHLFQHLQVIGGALFEALGLAAHSVMLALELSELAGDPEAETQACYLESHPPPIPVNPEQAKMFFGEGDGGGGGN